MPHIEDVIDAERAVLEETRGLSGDLERVMVVEGVGVRGFSTGAKKRDPVRAGVPDTWGVRSCSAEAY